MQIQPYLFFDGRCEEAIAFYQEALGAQKVMLVRYKESPEPPKPGSLPPGFEEKVMHARFDVAGHTILASDDCTGKPKFQGFALSLTPDNEADADRFFNGLAKGGKVQMPLSKTFFSPKFGMVTDRFGILWMVYIPMQ